MIKKTGTAYPGVRFKQGSRKPGGQLDRYFSIRYRMDGHPVEEGLGWASDGWTAKKAAGVLARLHEAQKTGIGPRTLKQAREHAKAVDDSAQLERQALAVASLTLKDVVLDIFLPWATANKRSWKADDTRLRRQILPILGDKPLVSITTAHVETLRDKLLASGLSPASTVQCLALVRKIFNHCLSAKSTDGLPIFSGTNPVKNVKFPKPDNARIRFLTYDQADALIELAEKIPDTRDAIVLSLNTGLRRGEIEALRWEDVDFDNALLRVADDGGKPGGIAYLNADALAMLNKREKSGTLVFPPPQRLSQTFKTLADDLGLNDGIADARQRIVFHSLRHTFASWLALGGVDIYRIMTLMRHKNIQMTMRYAHLIPDAKREAVMRLRPAGSGAAPKARPRSAAS